MRQLDLFCDRYKRYIVTKQKGNDDLWVIWDDWKLKETKHIFVEGKKAKEYLDSNLIQEYRYV